MSKTPKGTSYKKGDILEVYFPYREDPEIKKRRPAVVVGKTKNGYMMHMITSTIRGGKFEAREVKLDANDTNKLNHASVIRLDRLNEIPNSDIIKSKGGGLTSEELEVFDKGKKRYHRRASEGKEPKTDIAIQQAKAQAQAKTNAPTRGSPKSPNMRKTAGGMGA